MAQTTTHTEDLWEALAQFDETCGCWSGEDAETHAKTIAHWIVATWPREVLGWQLERSRDETRILVTTNRGLRGYWWPDYEGGDPEDYALQDNLQQIED